jgi:D-alanyl-D-alanine dipeptidase
MPATKAPLRALLITALLGGVPGAACALTVGESVSRLVESGDYVEITAAAGVAIDLKYATPHNFVGQNMYGDFTRAFLHRIAYAKLAAAIANLQAARPGYKLVIFDSLRPRSVQHIRSAARSTISASRSTCRSWTKTGRSSTWERPMTISRRWPSRAWRRNS